MSDTPHHRWIQEAVDGTISDADRARLEALIAADPAVRREYEQLTGTAALLDAESSINTPDNFKRDVMNQIDPHRYTPQAPKRPSSRAGGTPSLWQRLFANPGYAVAFAMGLVVGLATWALLDETGQGPVTGDLQGAMGIVAPESGTLVETIEIDAPGLSGTIAVRADGARVILYSDIRSAGYSEMVVTFSPARLRFETLPLQGRSAVVASRVDRVTVSADDGIGFPMVFHRRGGSAELSVTLQVAGVERWTGTISIPAK